MRRFLNADSYGSTGQGILGYNMFAYCNNNPIGSCDNGGNRPCPASLYGGSYSHDGGGQNPQPPIQYSFCEEGTKSGSIKNGREAYAKAQQMSSSLLSTGDFPGAIQSVTVEKTQYHKTGWSALGDSLGDNLLLSSASAAGGKVCSKVAAKVGIKIGGKFATVAGFGFTVVGGAILNCLHEPPSDYGSFTVTVKGYNVDNWGTKRYFTHVYEFAEIKIGVGDPYYKTVGDSCAWGVYP